MVFYIPLCFSGHSFSSLSTSRKSERIVGNKADAHASEWSFSSVKNVTFNNLLRFWEGKNGQMRVDLLPQRGESREPNIGTVFISLCGRLQRIEQAQ